MPEGRAGVGFFRPDTDLHRRRVPGTMALAGDRGAGCMMAHPLIRRRSLS